MRKMCQLKTLLTCGAALARQAADVADGSRCKDGDALFTGMGELSQTAPAHCHALQTAVNGSLKAEQLE